MAPVYEHRQRYEFGARHTWNAETRALNLGHRGAGVVKFWKARKETQCPRVPAPPGERSRGGGREDEGESEKKSAGERGFIGAEPEATRWGYGFQWFGVPDM
jgi:hypothetical protein